MSPLIDAYVRNAVAMIGNIANADVATAEKLRALDKIESAAYRSIYRIAAGEHPGKLRKLEVATDASH